MAEAIKSTEIKADIDDAGRPLIAITGEHRERINLVVATPEALAELRRALDEAEKLLARR